MSREESIEVKGARVVALEGCTSWPCKCCGKGLVVGDAAYTGPDGAVHADPAVCPPESWIGRHGAAPEAP